MEAEIIDIRMLAAYQFAPLLEAEARAWSERLHWDYSPAMHVITSCLAERRLTGYALVSSGRVEGYGFYVCEGEKGLIGDLFLRDPDGMQIDTVRLLSHLVETLLATPGIRRVEAQLPHLSARQLQFCLGAFGFKTYLRRFMAARLGSPAGPSETRGQHESEPFAGGEFIPEVWERGHDREAARLIYQTYQSHIDATVNDQYATAEGAARLIENIMELRGCGEPLPQASLVALHEPTRRIAGLVAVTAVSRQSAHIPQIAVAPEFQSRGIGTALLRRALRSAAEHGCNELSLTVTDLNHGAVRFYERLGFATTQTFGAFVWKKA